MKGLLHHFRVSRVIVTALAVGLPLAGCATQEIIPSTVPPVDPPPAVTLPHPNGLDLADLRAIFVQRGAPHLASEEIRSCDRDFRTLRERTQSAEELDQGAREFVKKDPVKYHWCVYAKILETEEAVKNGAYLDERQRALMYGYLFIAPVARAFLKELSDSRYLRWAVSHYRQASQIVFYRQVEPTPQLTNELVNVEEAFQRVRPAPEAPATMLEKYGIVPTAPMVPPESPTDRSPAGVSAVQEPETPALLPEDELMPEFQSAFPKLPQVDETFPKDSPTK